MQGLLICSKDAEARRVSDQTESRIGIVLNKLNLDTFPCVVDFFVYFKIDFFSPERGFELNIQVKDEDDNLISSTNNIAMYNKRPFNEIPTVEGTYQIKFPISSKGKIFVDLNVNENIIYSYPIQVL